MDEQNLEVIRQQYERLKSDLEVLRREIDDFANMIQTMEAAHVDPKNDTDGSDEGTCV